MVPAARCCSTGSGRLNLDLLISGPRVYLIYHPYAGARALLARPGSARCYGVARQREGSRQNGIGAPRLPYLSPLRGREGAAGQAGVCPLLRGSSPTRGVAPKQHRGWPPRLSYLSPLARARALLARPWSARCYGVARQRDGSRQNSIGGSGVLSLRHFSGWFYLSLNPLARGCRRSWRGEIWFRRRDVARPARAA